MINIITSFYVSKSIERQKEINNSLTNNLIFSSVKNKHLFVDNKESSNYLLQHFSTNQNYIKIKTINLGRQPFYSDLFEYANLLENEICMICNSDIWLSNIENNILINILNNNLIYSLTRHENDLSCPLINDYRGSHDAFIFKSSLTNDIIKHLKFYQNIWGSENVVLYELKKYGYKILNPCKQIIIIHEHKSNIRNQNRKRINTGDYDGDNVFKIRSEFSKPCFINLNKYA